MRHSLDSASRAVHGRTRESRHAVLVSVLLVVEEPARVRHAAHFDFRRQDGHLVCHPIKVHQHPRAARAVDGPEVLALGEDQLPIQYHMFMVKKL